jgi:rhamnose transport system permease protein
MTIKRLAQYRREAGVGLAIVLLMVVLAAAAPNFFTAENLDDLFLANLPVLIVALGLTFLIVSGEIDISIGSAFAVCGVAAGLLAKMNMPLGLVAFGACATGAALGGVSGSFVGFFQVPSIVVTLAMMIVLREALRWVTQGAWVQDLPPHFQWLGFTQQSYLPVVAGVSAVLLLAAGWASRHAPAVRALYATGSNPAAARLAGINTSAMKFGAFVCVGTLTGLAALLNSARFNQIPANAGIGLEMKVIAAVVIGGTSITGGRGTILGTLLGVILLGSIGPALTFLGVSAYWERAAQGGIILVAVSIDALSGRAEDYATHLLRARA